MQDNKRQNQDKDLPGDAHIRGIQATTQLRAAATRAAATRAAATQAAATQAAATRQGARIRALISFLELNRVRKPITLRQQRRPKAKGGTVRPAGARQNASKTLIPSALPEAVYRTSFCPQSCPALKLISFPSRGPNGTPLLSPLVQTSSPRCLLSTQATTTAKPTRPHTSTSRPFPRKRTMRLRSRAGMLPRGRRAAASWVALPLSSSSHLLQMAPPSVSLPPNTPPHRLPTRPTAAAHRRQYSILIGALQVLRSSLSPLEGTT
jgi:hypothetical protein